MALESEWPQAWVAQSELAVGQSNLQAWGSGWRTVLNWTIRDIQIGLLLLSWNYCWIRRRP